MAEENTYTSRPAPSFVHAKRPERSYTGPADPVALWAQARMIVGIAENQRDGSLRPQVEEVYKRLAVESTRVTHATKISREQPYLDELDQIDRVSKDQIAPEVILGSLGRAALGESTQMLPIIEVA